MYADLARDWLFEFAKSKRLLLTPPLILLYPPTSKHIALPILSSAMASIAHIAVVLFWMSPLIQVYLRR